LTVFVLRITDLPGTVLQRYPRRAADRTWRHRFTSVRDEGSRRYPLQASGSTINTN
jgi:hypothetical protein